MALIKGRQILFSNREQYIGTTYDHNSNHIVFRLNRVNEDGVDVANLVFRVVLKYSDTNSIDRDSVTMDVAEDHIDLIWEIRNSVLSHEGTHLIQLIAYENVGTFKWSTFTEVVYIENALGSVPPTAGELSMLENLEAQVNMKINLLDAEELLRKNAETQRQTNENTRITNENARNLAESQRQATFLLNEANRDIAENERKNAETARAETFRSSESSRAAAFNESQAARQQAYESAENARNDDYRTNETDREDKLETAIRSFNNDRSQLMQLVADAKHDALLAEQYKDAAAEAVGSVNPEFYVNFDDGEVHYEDGSSYVFEINNADGNLNYTKEVD